MTLHIVGVDCPETAFRAELNDGEFWDFVLNGVRPGDDPEVGDDFDDDAMVPVLPPCEVCGERGPCGYDMEGRPLIHATETAEVDDDEGFVA